MGEVVWNPGQTMVFGVSGDITSQEEWRDRMFLWDRLYWQTKRETLADIIQQVEPTMQGILILSIQPVY